MIKLTRPIVPSPLGSEYDKFLFAPIGEDSSGMLLSVLSALARLDIDPWQEAAKLARLPQELATQQLVALISVLPAGPGAQGAKTTALRLIALLPREAMAALPARARPSPASAATRSSATTYLIICMIFMMCTLVGQWLAARVRSPAAALSPTVSRAASVPNPASSKQP